MPTTFPLPLALLDGTRAPQEAKKPVEKPADLQGRTVQRTPSSNVAKIAAKVGIIVAAVLISAVAITVFTGANALVAIYCPPALAASMPVSLAIITWLANEGRHLIRELFTRLDTPGQVDQAADKKDAPVFAGISTTAAAPIEEIAAAPSQKELLTELKGKIAAIIKKYPLIPSEKENEHKAARKVDAQKALTEQMEKGLKEDTVNSIYGKVWERAGKPDELEFGRNHAFDLLSRFNYAIDDVVATLA